MLITVSFNNYLFCAFVQGAMFNPPIRFQGMSSPLPCAIALDVYALCIFVLTLDTMSNVHICVRSVKVLPSSSFRFIPELMNDIHSPEL